MESILGYWLGFEGIESDLYPHLGTTPEFGTAPGGIIRYAKAQGLDASLEQDVSLRRLRRAFRRGETVILNIQAWKDGATQWLEEWEDGHYVAMIGIDKENVFAMDPHIGVYTYLPLPEFLDRWHDYESGNGLVIRYNHLSLFMRGKRPPVRPYTGAHGPLVRID